MAIAEKEAISNSLEGYIHENAAVQALSAAKAFGKVLVPHVIGRTRIIKDGKGMYLLRVVDEEGDECFDANGKPKTVEGLVEDMRQSDDYSFAFDGEGATGSKLGSARNTSERPMSSPWSKKSFNATEQAKILKPILRSPTNWSGELRQKPRASKPL